MPGTTAEPRVITNEQLCLAHRSCGALLCHTLTGPLMRRRQRIGTRRERVFESLRLCESWLVYRCTCHRHALDACQPHVLGAAISCSLAATSLERSHISHISQRTAAASHSIYVHHVLGALAIHCAASLLWHSHWLFSLLCNYVCHLHVQETYRGWHDGKG